MREPAVMITWAGSHSARRRHRFEFERLGIPMKSLGPARLNSKRMFGVIPKRCLADALTIKGVSRSQIQFKFIQEDGYAFPD